MADLLIDEVVEHLESLLPSLQEQVLALVRALDISVQRGVLGSQLIQFAGSIPDTDIQLMAQAIESGCEQVDLNEW